MTLEDIKVYITRKNLNTRSSKRIFSDERAYLYAYIYHNLNFKNLTHIGRLFAPVDATGKHFLTEEGKIMGAKNHATVRSALIKVEGFQFDPEFIENTKELSSQIPMVIPKYKNQKIHHTRMNNVEKRGKEYILTVKVTRTAFYEYVKTQDQEIIMDFLFRHMIKSAPKKRKNTRSPFKKTFKDESNNNK